MSATKSGMVIQALELDSSIIESLPEPVLSELIGFIEYDSRLGQAPGPQDDHQDREPVSAGSVSWQSG